MSLIEFDVWTAPYDLSTAPDARLSTDDSLTDAGFNPVLYGEGDGFLEIHIDDPDTQYLQRRAFVRAVRTDTEEPIFDFILEEADTKILAKDSADKVIRWSGRGALYLLDRYRLGQAVYAPGQPNRGSVSVIDYWTWISISPGGILRRVWEEGFHHPDSFYANTSVDFTRVTDSQDETWVDVTDYQTRIGTSGLQVVADMMRMGLMVRARPVPDSVQFQAFKDLSFRTDRTSATFTDGKVRFQGGVNVAVELPQKIAALRERTHTLTRRKDGQYATETLNGSGEPYMDFREVPFTSDPDAVEAFVGAHHLNLQKQSLVAVVQHRIGDGGADGEEGYFPSIDGHYWPGDLVTVHTGSGEYDLNEQPLEVAGIRYFLRGADWMVECQLGAQSISANGLPALPVAGPSTVVTPPLRLCEPAATGGSFEDGDEVGQDADTSSEDRASGAWPGFFEEGVEITVPADIEAGTTLIAVVAWNRLGDNATRDSACYDEQGNTWVMDAESDPVGSSARIAQIWRCNVTTMIPTGDYIRWGAKGTTVEVDGAEFAAGRAFGVYYFNGTLEGPNVGATAGTFGSTMTVAAPAGDVVIGGICRHDSSVTGDGDWNALVPWTETPSGAGVEYTSVFGQWKQSVVSENWVCTSGANKDWSGIAVGYSTELPFEYPGSGPEDLVGTAEQAARCDHNHLAESLLTEETDTDLVLKPDGTGGVEWGTDATGGGGGGAWTTYTPTITASPTPPNLGTGGSISGAYEVIGKTLHLRVHIAIGTSPSAGSGIYQISLPAGITAKTGSGIQALTAYGFDNGTANRRGIGRVAGGATDFTAVFSDAGSVWSHNTPAAIANGDTYSFTGMIEID